MSWGKKERMHAAPTAGEGTFYPYLAPTLKSLKSFELKAEEAFDKA
jgi:hypothetical protein